MFRESAQGTLDATTRHAGTTPGLAPRTEEESLYGMDRELRGKQEARYDITLERQVVEWIELLTGLEKRDIPLGEWLRNGQVLCRMVNAVKPGTVKKVNVSNLAFKQMENITFFTNAARELGVPDSAMFATVDLFEEKNLGSVVNCVYTFGGVVQVTCPDYVGPPLGPPIHAENKDTRRTTSRCTDQMAGLVR